MERHALGLKTKEAKLFVQRLADDIKTIFIVNTPNYRTSIEAITWVQNLNFEDLPCGDLVSLQELFEIYQSSRESTGLQRDYKETRASFARHLYARGMTYIHGGSNIKVPGNLPSKYFAVKNREKWRHYHPHSDIVAQILSQKRASAIY
jgi:hypothetical protein